MNWTGWTVLLLLALLAVAGVARIYTHHEAPGRGRLVLVALRGAAIALLLLLLFDPELPSSVRAGNAMRAVLIDASLSMSVPIDGGGTRWDWARDRARALSPGGSAIIFGDEPRLLTVDSLDALLPTANQSALLRALQAAAEAGAVRATVVTDGALTDLDEVTRWLPRLGLALAVERAGPARSNRGITEIRAPYWVEAGEPIEIEVGLAALGAAGESVTISVTHEGRTLDEARVSLPAEGRTTYASLRFAASPPAQGTLARYDVSIHGSDAVPDDDVRSVYVDVTGEPAGLTVLSFQPDWEPRFLLPVLQRALGLPVQGFLRASPTRWVRIGTGLRGGSSAGEADARRAGEAAAVVVLHGYGGLAPGWARDLAMNARRVLILPATDPGDAPLPVGPGSFAAADWYLSESIPASPVAQHLAGLNTRELPPLPGMHLVDEYRGSWAAAHVSRGRRGVAYPVTLAGRADGRRWVVALGEGYWRWAFRDPASRDVYERLWSALGGWLIEDQLVRGDAVIPVRNPVARGQALRWATAGEHADSFHVRLTSQAGVVALDTMVVAPDPDTLVAPVVAPGHYTYAIRLFSNGNVRSGAGPISVDAFSDEFTRPAADVSRLEAPQVSTASPARRAGAPLRLSPWPWFLLILLLCTEWILRRRWGLR